MKLPYNSLISIILFIYSFPAVSQIFQSPSGTPKTGQTYTYRMLALEEIPLLTQWTISPSHVFSERPDGSITVTWRTTGTKTITVRNGKFVVETLNVTVSSGGSGTPTVSHWTKSGSELYYTGNVGIGNTNPSQKLHVSGNNLTTGYVRADGGMQVDGKTVIDNNASWHRSHGAAGWYNQSYGGGIYMTDATWIRTYGNKSFYHNIGTMRTDGTFQVGPSGNRFIVNSSGNVGIGNTAPTYPLHVKKTINSNWQGRFTNGASNVYLAHQSGYGMHINTGGTNSSSRYALEVKNASRTHLYVRDDGNVGVGTRSPAKRFHVSGDSYLQGKVHIGSTDTYFYRQTTNRIATQDEFYVMSQSPNTYLYSTHTYLGGSSGDNIHLRGNKFDWTSGGGGVINTSGNMGIGTTSPSEKLDVNGTARLRGLAQSNSHNRILAADTNGKIFWRDANSIASFDTNSNVTFGGNVSLTTGNLNVSSGYIRALNGEFRGQTFTTGPNPNPINIHMNLTTHQGYMIFDIDKKRKSGSPGYYIWRYNGSSKMYLNNLGRLGLGVFPTETIDINSGTIRLRSVAKESSSLSRILAVDANGRVFWKDAETIQGSIDPSENIDFAGRITIGNPSLQSSPTGKFYVNGPAYFTEVNVEAGPWPDYVFTSNYNLRSLDDVNSFIKANGHLPDVPSSQEVEEEGINVADMNATLLKKIEELTLYQIDLLDMLKKQQSQIEALKADIDQK